MTIEGRARGWAFAALGMLLVSTDSFFIRWSEEDSWTIAFWVSLFSVILYAGISVVTRNPGPRQALRVGGGPLVAVAVLAAISQISFVTAVTKTSVANVVVIVAATPIFAALIGRVFFGERTRRRVWTAIAITFAGVLLIVSRSVGKPSLEGDLLALLAVAIFATSVNIWRRWPEMNRMVALGASGLMVMSACAAVGVDYVLDGRAWFGVIGMGLIFNPLGRLLHTHAPRHAPASEVAMFTPVETVAAPIWAWLAFSEVPSSWTVVGGAIVISGMLYGTLGRRDDITAAATV